MILSGRATMRLRRKSIIEVYPVWVQQKFLFAAIRAALEASDVPLAQRYLEQITFAALSVRGRDALSTLPGPHRRGAGPHDGGARSVRSGDRCRGPADARRSGIQHAASCFARPNRSILPRRPKRCRPRRCCGAAIRSKSICRSCWPSSISSTRTIGLAFEITRDAAANNPESKPIQELTLEAEAQFAELFLNGAADQLGDLDALSLYYDFRQLTPAGARGDEMIRNLARRLVKVDLLAQAADLLEYQIDSRLQGAAQAQVAAELALIRIADRNPEGALRVLNRTRIANLAADASSVSGAFSKRAR